LSRPEACGGIAAAPELETLQRWVPLRRAQPGAALRLLCFPFAGGSAAAFRAWPGWLGSGVEVCAVELPGHGGRLLERPLNRLPELVSAILGAISPLLGGSYALFGHSFGGLVAFEVARALRRQGAMGPRAVLASATRPPQLSTPHLRALHRLGREELVEELRRLRGTPEVVLRDGELLGLVLPALRADFEAYAEYQYVEEAPLSADLYAFGGADDRIIGTGNLDAWRTHTAGRFSLDVLPGEHFFPFSHAAAFLAAFVRVVNEIVPRENAAARRKALR